ncbi:MAG: hypothetical protein V2B19_23580 [Pseudomonadota bacterium]
MKTSLKCRASSGFFFLAFGLVFLLAGGGWAYQVSWVGGASGYWGDPANWSNAMAPGAGDDVIVDTGLPVTIIHDGGETVIGALSMIGILDIQGGAVTVSGNATIDGELIMAAGAALIANGSGASITVTGPADIGGGDILSANGGQIIFPGAIRHQGGGRLRAEGPGSRLEMKNLSFIGTGDPEPIDGIFGAVSREYSAYHMPYAVLEGESKGIFEAYSREVSGYRKQNSPEEGFEKGVFAAYSREVSAYHRQPGVNDEPEEVLVEAVSREVSAFHRPLGLSDEPEKVLIEAISREVAIEHLKPPE